MLNSPAGRRKADNASTHQAPLRAGGASCEEDGVAAERGGFWVGLGAAVCHPLTHLLGRRRYQGLDHIPTSGPALLVCNHVSYLDPIYTAVFVHRRGRLPRFLAKDSLWQIRILRYVLDGTGQIPVRREHTDAGNSLPAAEQALREGKVVLIYPEGTITRDPDYWPMMGRTGVARLALDTGAPVIPVAHWGTQHVYDHYNRRFRPLPRTDVVVRAGPPLDLARFQGQPVDRQLLHEVTDAIMVQVRNLLADVRGEPAPTRFFAPMRPASEAGEDL
jgi:1-acyl-sn-glycerol-3-phosphate acyltransferase